MKPLTRTASLTLLVIAWLAWSESAWSVPRIQHWQSHGAGVYYVHAPELPMVDIKVVFDAGSARDGIHKGLASFTNQMLTFGAGDLDADAIAEQFERLGAEQSNDVDQDKATISLRSLSDAKYLQPALKTLAEIIARPNFPEADFERERKRVLAALEHRKQRPGSIAKEAFFKAMYGEHPYGHLTLGTEEQVKAFDIALLKSFHQRYYVANNAMVVIVGAVDRKQAGQIVATLLAPLAKGSKPEPLPPVQPLTEAKNIHIPHPSSQTHILIGHPMLQRGDPDYYNLYVANHVFGGNGLVSRLSEEVREKRGLAYSAYSYIMPLRVMGPFQMGAQTRNDQTTQALDVMRSSFAEFIKNGISSEELSESQKNIIGGFPLRIDSNSEIAAYLTMIGFYGMPLDYLERFPREVAAASIEAISEAVKRRFDPEKMVTITVGGS